MADCRKRMIRYFYAEIDNETSIKTGTFSNAYMSFLCPNGTVFNQATFVCEWWHNVDCSKSEQHFAKNNEFYKSNLPISSDSVEVDKHPPSARSHGYEEYPSAEEYSSSY
ncbi:chitin-binding type-2 domain-containing protein [Trichonephila clavipes]|uniref:Chitin-binding type-2 domain-containing protein n=1 Tax=Trichonephila clavipes TaxID=2585209 RepID=A0A8X6RPM2_TRICX|nr:chitin-binding type-2 domain-containing protein [Trichonephila clavipes]